MNPNYERAVLSDDELRFLIQQTSEITKNSVSNAKQLREAAQMHAVLAAHHSACIVNLIDNAQEADMNARMGDERRADNPAPQGEKEKK